MLDSQACKDMLAMHAKANIKLIFSAITLNESDMERAFLSFDNDIRPQKWTRKNKHKSKNGDIVREFDWVLCQVGPQNFYMFDGRVTETTAGKIIVEIDIRECPIDFVGTSRVILKI